MSDIITIKDIISKSQQKFLFDLATSREFDWHYLPEVTYEKTTEGNKNTHGFCNLMFNEEGVTNQYFNSFYPILLEFLNREDLTLKKLLRVRLGFLLNTIYSMPHLPYSYNNPHIDYACDHKVGLYYLNECDGDTYIFNQTELSERYTIKERVRPEQGKFVCFDGKHYHASGCPKMHSQRLVLTFNFVAS
jgi:hypothetical protein